MRYFNPDDWAVQLNEKSWKINSPLMDNGCYGTPTWLMQYTVWQDVPYEYAVLETAIYMVMVARFKQSFTCISTGTGLLMQLKDGDRIKAQFKDYELKNGVLNYIGSDSVLLCIYRGIN